MPRNNFTLPVVKSTVPISLRAASLAVIALWLLSLFATTRQTPRPHPSSESDGIEFSPCNVWDQIPISVSLATLATATSFLVVFITGLRNRPAKYWAPITLLISLPIMIHDQLWDWTHCLTQAQQAVDWAITASILAMALLHIWTHHRSVSS